MWTHHTGSSVRFWLFVPQNICMGGQPIKTFRGVSLFFSLAMTNQVMIMEGKSVVPNLFPLVDISQYHIIVHQWVIIQCTFCWQLFWWWMRPINRIESFITNFINNSITSFIYDQIIKLPSLWCPWPWVSQCLYK